MFALRLLNGKAAGQQVLIRRFPFRVGRAANAHLRLDVAGVWDEHLQLQLDAGQTLCVSALGDAIARVNGEVVRECPLRTGDIIELGESRLQFWLGPIEQKGLRVRETMVWLSLGLLTAGEIFLALRLPQ